MLPGLSFLVAEHETTSTNLGSYSAGKLFSMGIERNTTRSKHHHHGGMKTASAMPISTKVLLGETAYQNRVRDWQEKVLRYADSIPEAYAAAKYVENSISRVQWEVGKRKPNGDIEEVTEGEAVDLVRTLYTLDAGRVANQLFTVGESNIVVTEGAVDDKYFNPYEADLYWRSLSIRELETKDSNMYYQLAETGKTGASTGKKLDLNKQSVFRIWSPDRARAEEASSPHKSMLEILEAFALHTIADKAFALSVVAGAGILYIPNDDFAPEIQDPSGAPVPGTQRHFDERLNEAMSLSINNRSSADAVVPVKIYGRAEYADGLRHLLLSREDNADAFHKRMQTYRERYAGGIDLPAEIVLGLGSSNHWTAWKVDQNTWTYHLAPMAQVIGDGIAESWLIPRLKAMNIADAEDYVIVPNGRKVVEKTDNTTTMISLFELGAINAETLMIGLDLPAEWAVDGDASGNAPDQADVQDMPSETDENTQPSVRPQTGSAGDKSLARVTTIQNEVSDKLFADLLNLLERYTDKSLKAVSDKFAAGDEARIRDVIAAAEGEIGKLLNSASRSRLNNTMKALGSTTGYRREIADYLRASSQDHDKAVDFAVATLVLMLSSRVYRSEILVAGGKESVPSDYLPPVLAQSIMSIAAGGQVPILKDNYSISDIELTPWNADPLWLEQVGRLVGEPLGVRFVWNVGHPRFPFPPHQALAGVSWGRGEVGPLGEWHPGDHHGCQCSISVELV